MRRHWPCLVVCGLLLLLAAAPAARAEDPNPASIHSAPGKGAWPLYRQWNKAEVAHYSRWIEHIYDVKADGTMPQRMARIEEVLSDPAINLLLDPAFAGTPSNPQMPRETMQSLNSVIDCAKLAQTLGVYYAYRRGLPWMNSHVRSGDGQDIRVATWNEVRGQGSSFDYGDLHQFAVDSAVGFCTGNYRVEPHRGNAEASDTVPIAITREHLVPGALWYLDGHVLVLGKVDEFGDIYFLDSTLDRTRDIYTHNGYNAATGLTAASSLPGEQRYAGCYRGFRMYRFPIAETNKDGEVTRVRRRTDAEMAEFGYNLEQYDKLAELMANGEIVEHGQRLDSMPEWMRLRLSTHQQIDPIAVLHAHADRLQQLFQAREEFVQRGWNETRNNGAIVFPENQGKTTVFNARGRWGDYSSAVLDLGNRIAYFRLLGFLEAALHWYDYRPEYLAFPKGYSDAKIWSRRDLAAFFRMMKNKAFEARTVTYTNSAGNAVTLTLRQIEERLYDLSFDPNHPPELRWGAQPGTAEVVFAQSASTPLPNGDSLPMEDAYRRQRYYRVLLQPDGGEESYLRNMVTSGFYEPGRMDDMLENWLRRETSPPLVPAIGRAAYLAQAAK